MPTLASLQKGERGIITDFSVSEIPLKLLEMGCLPGNEVQLVLAAPFKDPIYLNINGSHLAIRKEVAAQIKVELIP